jgi:6-pyruvoyl-tetrahydropterin synthase
MSEVCAMIFTGEVIVRCCYGHRLNGYAGRCARIHGHNGVVTVRVEADSLDAQGFVADFYEIRTAVDVVVDGFDHALILGPGDPMLAPLRAAGEHHVELATPPTAEHLAALVLERLSEPRGQRWRVRSVRWEEEPGFAAEVSARVSDGCVNGGCDVG